jgi:hypothetical protein
VVFDMCLNVVHVVKLSEAEANNKHSDRHNRLGWAGTVVVVVVALLGLPFWLQLGSQLHFCLFPPTTLVHSLSFAVYGI